MPSSPDNRVRHLLGLPLDTRCSWRKPVTQSPVTLTGGDTGLYSYRMPIAWRDGNDWIVTRERSSATTNRHIHAVHGVMRDTFGPGTDETIIMNRRYPYSFYGEEAVPVTRYKA